MELEFGTAGGGKPRQVALHVRQENRHPRGGEPFGQDLEGHRLARTRRPGDQTVAVGILQREPLRIAVPFAATTDKNLVFQLIRPPSQLFHDLNILS